MTRMNLRANARVFGWCPNYLSMDATVASSSALTAHDFTDPCELDKLAAPVTVDNRVYLSKNELSDAFFSETYHEEIHGPAKENPLVYNVGPALYVDLNHKWFYQLTLREILLWQGTAGNEKFNFIFNAPEYDGLERNFCLAAGGMYTGGLLSVLIYRAENDLLHEPFSISARHGNVPPNLFIYSNPYYSENQLMSTDYYRGYKAIGVAHPGKANRSVRTELWAKYNKPFVDSLNKTLTGVEEVRVQVQQLPAA